MGIAVGCHGVAVFHVRHVDIDDAIQQGEGLGTVVAAGIVHQRQPEPLAGRDQRRFKNLRHHMTGADKINVMTALGLQIQHHGRQFPAFKQVQIGGVKAVIFMRWLRGRSCQIETLFYVGSQ
jgi:hypothetical protein